MQDLLKKDSDMNAAHSTSPNIVGCPSWWTSTESQIQQASLSNNLTLKMATPPPHCQSAKQLSFQYQDQDSSSTQSTDQSYPEVASAGESNPYGQNIITTQAGDAGDTTGEAIAIFETREDAWVIVKTGGKTSIIMPNKRRGYHCTQGKAEDGHTPDYVLPPHVDYRQTLATIPLSYPDPYGGLLGAYGPQAVIHHSQMMGMAASTRVPLPLDLAQDEPIYVNAKQYRAILRRRQFRSKLEAQSKLSKVRKPYMHESRHLHAIKRARGSGGRFLNMNKLEKSKTDAPINGRDISGSAQLQSTTKMSKSEVHHHESYQDTSMNSCSDITSAPNSESIFNQQEFKFSVYTSRVGGPMQGGGGGGGLLGRNHRSLSVLQ